jgi:hypothetical protein
MRASPGTDGLTGRSRSDLSYRPKPVTNRTLASSATSRRRATDYGLPEVSPPFGTRRCLKAHPERAHDARSSVVDVTVAAEFYPTLPTATFLRISEQRWPPRSRSPAYACTSTTRSRPMWLARELDEPRTSGRSSHSAPFRDGCLKLREVHRLHEMRGEACPHRPLSIDRLPVAAHRDKLRCAVRHRSA